MAVTGTQTNADICNQALKKLGIIAKDEEATPEDVETARLELRRMLKSWQNMSILLPMTAEQSVTLSTARVYTLDPVRPLEIQSVRFKRNGSEIPMERMTRNEYDRLPIKTTSGQPTQYYYDRQKEAARLYVWPVLATASGETLEITYTREFSDVVLTDAVDFPAEMESAVVYGLAARLADDYQMQVPSIVARAEKELDEALAFDREGSVFFSGEEYD